MSKLIMVGLLVGSLLAGATPVMAAGKVAQVIATQGGIGDPLTLAASGVVIPFLTTDGIIATLQVASPVSDNPGLHMFFFADDCSRIPISVGLPLTTNDIAFQQISSSSTPPGPVPAGTNGLITIAKSNFTGFGLVPLDDGHPIHARVYIFDPLDQRSRVIEPIIVNTAEFPEVAHWWSPLRTGGDFFAPLQGPASNGAVLQTDLLLVCPTSTIEGATGAAFGSGATGTPPFTTTGFPQIDPAFPDSSVTNGIDVLVFDTNERPLRDFTTTCSCVTVFQSIAVSLNPIFGDAIDAPNGTFTKITSVPATDDTRVTFTGYTSTFSVGNPLNAFFARFNNGSQPSLGGPLGGTLTSTR